SADQLYVRASDGTMSSGWQGFVASPQHITINLVYDAQALAAPQSFRNGMQAAANIIQAAIIDPITVNIAVGYGEFGGFAISPNVAGNVLIAAALHELTTAMGRIAGLAMDICRYNENRSGSHVFGGAIPATPAYFSIDGGHTDMADFGISSDPGDFLNSGVQGP